jgi:hypothetical protein
MTRRAIKIGEEVLEISKYTVIKHNKKRLLYLDELNDGTWRLIHNEDLIPDLTKIDVFEIIRED